MEGGPGWKGQREDMFVVREAWESSRHGARTSGSSKKARAGGCCVMSLSAFYCCDKLYDQRQFREGMTLFHLTLPGSSPAPLSKVRAGTSERMLACILDPWLPPGSCFLIQLWTTC